MGALDVRTIRRVPGRLAYGCTDLTAAWPHGGTGLGAVRGIMLRRYSASFPVTIEAYGGIPVEYLEAGEAWGIAARVRTDDDDAISTLFPNTAVGTTTQHRVVSAPGTVKAGAWASAREVVLVFTPEGATHAQSATAPDVEAPFVILYRALPMLAEQAEIAFHRTDDLGIPALFMGIPHSTKGTLKWGRRRDLTL